MKSYSMVGMIACNDDHQLGLKKRQKTTFVPIPIISIFKRAKNLNKFQENDEVLVDSKLAASLSNL